MIMFGGSMVAPIIPITRLFQYLAALAALWRASRDSEIVKSWCKLDSNFLRDYGCLWMFMDVYGCLGCLWMCVWMCVWMFMDVYGCLWMFMNVYECLWMFMVIFAIVRGVKKST